MLSQSFVSISLVVTENSLKMVFLYQLSNETASLLLLRLTAPDHFSSFCKFANDRKVREFNVALQKKTCLTFNQANR